MLSLGGMSRLALLVIATSKVSVTVSVSVTAATPLSTVMVTAWAAAAGSEAGVTSVPVTNALTVPLKVGVKMI